MRRKIPVLTALTSALAILPALAPPAALILSQAPAARAGAAEPPLEITVEAIYGDPPLTGYMPKAIRWLPDESGISYLLADTAGGEKETFFLLARMPAGARDTVCVVDTMTVPQDLAGAEGAKFKIGSYTWSNASDRILFTFRGEIFLMNRRGETTRLTFTEEEEENPAFSPDDRFIAYTRQGDLYLYSLADSTEARLTSTGCDSVFNGVLDWVYMEEIFTRGKTRAFWWSPDGTRIAFLETREEGVPTYPLVDFASVHGALKLERYPKPGDPNPKVRVGVCHLASRRIQWIDTGQDSTWYVVRVYWAGARRLAVEILDRKQKDLRVLIADPESGTAKEILREQDTTWVNVTYMKHYYEKKKLFVWASERDGFAHLYLYNLRGTLLRRLTRGPWVVSSLDGVNEKKGVVYFTALKESPLERHFYQVSVRSGSIKRLSKEPGTHTVKVSPECRYYLDTYSRADMPPVISVRKIGGKELFVLASSRTDVLAAYDLPMPDFFTFTAGDVTYYAKMIKPPAFEPAFKYPVLVYVYGGPHAQVVRNAWGGSRYLWHALMAKKGYIVFSMDNRGSYGRGKRWEEKVARCLGEVELADQLAGVDYLKSLPFVDETRIGIWGWSYGGFMTCTAMVRAPGVFRVGAAVAPVTDWKLYDSIYTERYMGTPEENEEGYSATSVLALADSLRSAFLLVHGTSDDNVHMQNSMQMVRKLIDAGKDFELMLYPGKLHGIRGKKDRVHLFEMLTRFFERNL